MFNIPLLSDREFKAIRKLVYEKSGIALGDEKKSLVQSRLGKLLRKRGITSFKQYLQKVINDSTGEELTELINAISTNFTHFFREKEHFEFLKNVIIPTCNHKKIIKIWSAGCSSGEEPYSIAITLFEAIKDIKRWQVKILATDISTQVLKKAMDGIYKKEQLVTLSKTLLFKYFEKRQGYYQIRPEIKGLIKFKKLNLLDPFSFNTQFNVIFCRNVMIYFDKQTKEQLVNRLYDYVMPGGYLFVGHAESLMGLKHKFRYVKPAIYQKIDR